MIPAIYVNVGEGALVAHCLANKIGISSIESLPNGGTKIVCRTAVETDRLRLQLKPSLIKGGATLERYRLAPPTHETRRRS
jgi:hypothetical protein